MTGERGVVSGLVGVVALLSWACGSSGGGPASTTRGISPSTVTTGVTTAMPPGTGEQVLALTATPASEPSLEPSDVVEANELVESVDAAGLHLLVRWPEIEPEPGQFDWSSLEEKLQIFGAGRPRVVTFSVPDTAHRAVPEDLREVPFDAAEFEKRYFDALDALLDFLSGYDSEAPTLYLSIGNEVDEYFKGHPGELSAYESLVDSAFEHLHQTRAGLPVGITTTFEGTFGADAETWARIHATADAIFFTYYPPYDAAATTLAEQPLVDLPAMVEYADGRPVVLQEVGFSSSVDLGSSEAAQAEFVTNVLRTWSELGAAVPFLGWYYLHDVSGDRCEEMVNYFADDSNTSVWEAFLCHLGLRHSDGTPKAGWDAFVAATGE
ncbi:MAG: hypothetical protein JJLCMIEE_00692 [Acidimicrobiales bacterium]|nr:hypothetical protein [Acidimicrobiales bacterium]